MSDLSKVYDRSRVPLYIQVASVMRRRIETNQCVPSQKISTLVELEREFEVARATIRQAIDILRQESLLHSQQGRGTFVAEKSIPRHWFKLATSWDVLVGAIKDNVIASESRIRRPFHPRKRRRAWRRANTCSCAACSTKTTSRLIFLPARGRRGDRRVVHGR